MTVYIDDHPGIRIDQGPKSCAMKGNPNALFLGADDDGGPRPFCRGALADIRIYDRILSREEVSTLQDRGAPE